MRLISNHLIARHLRKDAKHLRLVKGATEPGAQLPQLSGLAIEALWERHDKLTEPVTRSKGAACVVGFSESDTVMLRTMLRQVGLGPCASCLRVDQLLDLASLQNAFTYLVVNVDAFEDTDAAVAAMMAFRQLRAEIIVILVSAAVAMDDLGAERRLIGDATLRAPVTLGRLQRGVVAAFENNTTKSRDTAFRRS